MRRKSIFALVVSLFVMAFVAFPGQLRAEDPLSTLQNHEITDSGMGNPGAAVSDSASTATTTSQMEQIVGSLEKLISEYERLIAQLEEQVRQAEAAATSPGTFGDVDVNSKLNVRAGPWGTIIGKLSHGDKVLIAEKEGDWFKIRFGDGYGYVHSYYIDAAGYESASQILPPSLTQPTSGVQTPAPGTPSSPDTQPPSDSQMSSTPEITSDAPSDDGQATPGATTEGGLRITFMDIGRNDGILIECAGEVAFFDAGMHSYGLKAIKNMSALGITKLKYYVGTHGHADHIGGGAAIIKALKPDQVLIPHDKVRSAIQKQATSSEKDAAKNASYKVLKRGGSVMLGTAKIECLGPLKLVDTEPGAIAENYNSIVLMLTYGSNRFLLTADTTGNILSSIDKASPGSLKCDVFKSPHHNGGVSKSVLRLASPKYVVVSTSKDCMPSSSYKSTCSSLNAKMMITVGSADGNIRMISNGEAINVERNVKF